jgi:hypothetical protein
VSRKQRIDSNAAAAKVARAVTKEILPPDHIVMDDRDWPFWRSVIAEFPKAEWTSHQLEVAAQLSKAMADLEMVRQVLRRDGYVTDENKPSPHHAVARDLTNAVMSLRRNLQLHARAQQGEARDAGKRRGMAKSIEAGVMDAFEDDLIARPSVQ